MAENMQSGGEDTGDERTIRRIVAPFVSSAWQTETGGASLRRDPDGSWHLLLKILRLERYRHYSIRVDPDAHHGRSAADGLPIWALRKLGPGVWDVQPSVIIPEQLHAFITVVAAPDPAPWESPPPVVKP